MKIVLSLAAFLMPVQMLLAKSHDIPTAADYVIVGVGTAGAVMARELSDDKCTSVVALQVGENLTEVPVIKYSAGALATVLDGTVGPPFYDNGFTVPQPNADDRQLLWAVANPEGGASSINAGAYCRSTKEFNAKWEAAAGPLWSVKRLQKVYKKLENYHGRTDDPSLRGYHGPLEVQQSKAPSTIARKFTKAIIRATGFDYVEDYNDPKTPIGISSKVQYTHHGKNGKYRVSSVNAFLDDDVVTDDGYGKHGRQLRILFDSMALRTIWDGTKAIGVEYILDGESRTVYAEKGIIVCAGLMSSPFLLHSGVGASSLLDSLGIPVVFDNPNVGQGLCDQPSIRMVFSVNPNDFIPNPNELFTQISWLPAVGGDPAVREIRIATASPVAGITLFILDLCQPKSRGSITINSSDPLDPPLVDLGTLTDSRDLDTLQDALQVYVKNINDVLSQKDPSYELLIPPPFILDDSDLVRAFIRETIASNEHFQNHCKMAPLDQGGVVDSRGAVHGVRNLWVADNSVVPCMDGSPMSTGYLVARNIANILKGR